MAKITGSTSEKIFSLKQWGGLNENPDGDTKLKLGEASVMTNWRVTRDGNLKRRPGSELVCGCRSIYTPTASNTVTDVFSTTDGDTEITLCDALVSGSARGTIALSGGIYDKTVSTAGSFTGKYFTYKGKYWQLNAIAVDDSGEEDVYTVKAKRCTAEASGTYGIVGMWSGWLNNQEIMLVACQDGASGTPSVRRGYIYEVSLGGTYPSLVAISGENPIQMPGHVHMFGFGGKVYFLTGSEYYEWDGVNFKVVDGYDPVVVIALAPDGTNELYEGINLLTSKRRVWLSPDGETDEGSLVNRTFQLPEKNLYEISYVKDLATDTILTINTDYEVNATNGIVVLHPAGAKPPLGTDSYEVGYKAGATVGGSVVEANFRYQVTNMRFSELYSGTQDTRVFLYGDGSNQCLYSGIDYWGTPRADYFPDLNACAVGDANTPITSMIRHYSTLVCYKRASAWSLTYGVISLTSDTMSPAFYATPVNRRLGNEPMGQVVLVNNSPVTLTAGEVYQWSNSSYYSSNLTQDERQARRISDRIQKSIKEFSLEDCFCYDDNYHQEYYICYGDDALVWNYASDVWYKYEDLGMVDACNYGGELYYGTADGWLFHLTDEVATNNTDPIVCYWESGAMDFGQDYMRKYAAMLWIGIKPDNDLDNADESHVVVTVRTDRKEEYSEKVVTTAKARVDGEPFMTRLKIKAKKFTFYTLILENDGEGETPTVNCADIRVRFMGYAK